MDFFKLFGEIVVDTKEAIDALKETSEEAEKTGESANKIGDGFKKNGEETKVFGSKILDVFKKVATAGAAVVASVVAIGTAMMEVADSTRAYRLEMGKLKTAFESAGHTTKEATKTYQTLYSILGETERAVEASQHIAKLCETEEEMIAMTDACVGAFALFDDSLPIEGLMEAANETAKTGQLTGVLTDALNWAGSSEAEFQKKLDACNTERARAALITEELIALYADSADAYKKNNKDILAATSAQEKLNTATGRWGKIFEPVATSIREGLADILNYFADLHEYGGFEEYFASTATTSEEAAQKVEALKGRMEELNSLPSDKWTSAQISEYVMLQKALKDAETRYADLVVAEQEAGSQASATATATAEATAQFSEITEQYVSDAQALFEKFAETYDGIYNRVAGWFDPFEKAKINVRTNVNDMMAAMQSQIDFNNSYTENLQALKEYGLGSLSDAFQSYGAEGAAYAKAIVDAVEKAGGATSEKGQEIIQGFADINQQVTESQAELAQTTALMNGEFEAELQDMNESYEAAIDALDKSAEANTAAIATFEGFLQGMNKKFPEIETQMTTFGSKITDALQKGIDSVSVPITFTGDIPGLDVGMDYVPYDNYLAYLHKGEAVLTKEEAAAWRAGKGIATDGNNGDPGTGGGGVTVNQYIEAVPQTPVELASATAAYFEQARWVT